MKILKAKKNCYVSLRIYPREIYFFQILGIRGILTEDENR